MIKEARQNRILEIVNARKIASLSLLMEETDSSESTIRADLIELDRLGKLLRLRGGAQAINDESTSYELSVDQKMGIQLQAKKAIAEYAYRFVKPNSMIYIDAGTTTYQLAEILDVPNLKVCTNSLLIARKTLSKGLKTYLIGGELKLSTDALIGPMAQEILRRFRFDCGFFGTNGVDLEQGFTTPDVEEATMKEKAMSQCAKAYILADSSKFDVVTAVRFCPFRGEILITESIHKNKYKNLGILEAKL